MKKILTGIARFFRNYPVAGGCVVFCLIPVLAWVAFDVYSRIRFASTIRSIEREGIICRYSGFRERYASSPEAVLAEFDRLGKAMSVAELNYIQSAGEFDAAAFVAGETKLIEEADAFLDQNPQLFQFHDEQSEQFPSDLFSRDVQCARWMRINVGRIRLLVQEGRFEEAARLFDRSARLRDYLLSDVFLISWCAAVVLENFRLEILNEFAATGTIARFSPEQLRGWELATAETEAIFKNRFPVWVEGEMTIFSRLGENPDSVRGMLSRRSLWEILIGRVWWLYRPVVRLNAASGLELYREIRPKLTATENIAAILTELNDLSYELGLKQNDFRYLALARLWNPWKQVFSQAGTIYARQRTLRAGLAAERFLRDHGRSPATLEELVPEYLPEVPRNPFTGDPLKLESGRLSRLLPDGKIEPFEGFRISGGGSMSAAPVEFTRMIRTYSLPVGNHSRKVE